MKLSKRLLATVLTVSILLGSAFIVDATETAEETVTLDASISDLMNANRVNPLSGNETEPFNTAPGASILMTKENELILYTSNKKGVATKDDFITDFEKMDSSTSYATESNDSPELDLFFVTAVALDASGNGTDDHIAFLGVKAFDSGDGADASRAGEQVLRLVLYNARRAETVAIIELGSVKDWVDRVEHWSYKTFFSVTAGDYDNDGVDEIACTDAHMGVQMIEIEAGEDSVPVLYKSARYDWMELVPKAVGEKMAKAVTASAGVHRRALISLATGNFDGTGAEELAVAVSTNHPDEDELLPEAAEAYSTQVAVVTSPLADHARIRAVTVHETEASQDEETQDNVVHRVVYVGQIAAGDLDGDRMDEIAIVGYTGKIEATKSGNPIDGGYEYDDENIVLCYAKLDGNLFDISAMTVDAMTPFIEEGFFDGNDTLVPLAVDAAKLHGPYGKESLFVGGKVYQFSEDHAAAIYTHEFFNKKSSYTITDAYVEHVTSGVFGGPDPLNGNKPMVNEQFIFTVVEKDNSQNQYNYKVGFISMGTGQDTSSTSFADNAVTMKSDGYLLEERPGGLKNLKGQADTNYGTALIPVAVDIDDDGLLVKHVKTTYFYEDPSVEAVLQAAPYFSELGSWNEFNSSTTYSITVSRSLIDVSGYSHSIHAGFKGKVGGDATGELELKIGYALDMDFEHEKAYTTAYTTTFEAGSYDTVVVQRTPYVCYEYAYVDVNGELLTGEDAGVVVLMEAMQPVYFQLSVDEYNRFVDEYNAMAARHDEQGVAADGEKVQTVGDSYRLVKITDDVLPSDATGNPQNYRSTLFGGEYISQGTYALSTNGGYTTSEFSKEVEETYSAVYAHGMHFEIEGVAPTPLGVNIGGFAETSFQETCGYGNATINGTATGGSVANIIPSNYSETEQETLKLYGFNWRCALWKQSLMTDAYGNPYCDKDGNVFLVPIVGYVVTNVKRPVSAPTGVEAYLVGNGYRVMVEWKPFVGATDEPVGYYVYRSCDNEAPVRVNDVILPYTTTSFVDTAPLRPGKIYTYYVAACYNNGNANYLTMNSKSSTVVWGIPLLSEETTDNGAAHVASLFGYGSITIVLAMAVLWVAVASAGIVLASKKKKHSAKSRDNE